MENSLSPKALAQVTQMIQAVNIARAQLDAYVKGCLDTLGLDGDYDLDSSTGVFTKREPPMSSKEAD